jgi:hypothetical protein
LTAIAPPGEQDRISGVIESKGGHRMIRYRSVNVSDQKVFYREAGEPQNPTLLLLHGFPTSSHMFRDLIPLLADRYHIVAPDLPGFGNIVSPPRGTFDYTFDNLAGIIAGFVDALRLSRYALYVFDYGAPVGFRLAVAHPEHVSANRQPERERLLGRVQRRLGRVAETFSAQQNITVTDVELWACGNLK